MASTMYKAANLVGDLFQKVKSKYGIDSFEAYIFECCILDTNRRIISWLRQEPVMARPMRFSLFSRFKSILLLGRSLMKVCFLGKCDFVFFPTNETHFVQHIPVMERLRSNGFSVLLVTNKRRLFMATPKGIPKFFISTNFNPFVFGTRDVNIDDSPISLKFLSELRLKASMIKVFLNLLGRRTNANCIVLGNELSLEGKVAEKMFRKLNARIFSIQHGGVNNPLYCFSTVDTFFSFGAKSKDLLIGYGVPARNIVVAGPPYLNRLRSNPRPVKGFVNWVTDDRADIDQIALVLLSGPGHSTSVNHNQSIFAAIQKVAAHFPNILFLFKLHVKDRIENYRILMEPDGRVVFVNNNDLKRFDISVFDLMVHSSCVLSGASSSVLEAMVFSKPVFTFDFNNEFQEIDFIKAGVTFHVVDEQEALAVLNDFFSGRAQIDTYISRMKLFIEDYFYFSNGSPEEVIARVLGNSNER